MGSFTFLLCLLASFADFARGVAFSPPFAAGHVSFSEITDASGLGASRRHPGYFYTHNDHGGAAKLYVLNATGHLQAQIYLQGEALTNYDWEDLAVGPCGPGSHTPCIYIGDFGDGEGHHKPKNNIFRVPEPAHITDQVITVSSLDKLKFSWDQHDCDTLLVSPDASIYVISKTQHAHAIVAKLPELAWGTDVRVDVRSTDRVNIHSDQPGPRAGDISLNGDEVLIKTKYTVYYWNTLGSRDYIRVLQNPGTRLQYAVIEPQGEAICWGPDGRDYYTLSEGVDQPFFRNARV